LNAHVIAYSMVGLTKLEGAAKAARKVSPFLERARAGIPAGGAARGGSCFSVR